MENNGELTGTLKQTADLLTGALEGYEPSLHVQSVGTVTYVGPGIVWVSGLKGVQAEELLAFPGDCMGMAFNVGQERTGVVLLDQGRDLGAGDEVRRTSRVLDVPVGEHLLGRVLDAHGNPLDGLGEIKSDQRRPVERAAPAIMDRLPVTEPLQTGLKVVDALIPIGRGQRELIIGDRQTGKTAVAIDAVINQKETEVICIYCAVGKRLSAVAKVVADLQEKDALSYCIVVVATEEDPPGLQFITPYAAMTMGETFMEQGKDVMVIMDDLTRHARAYRELSLLLRRPPGREAFPGDIFYVHSRLLERSTHLNEDLGGGSLTALPIIETEAQNISAYIPTNLISITDGQIYLSPELFRKGILPAVDVGRSVSRVGGKTQLSAYRAVAGDLRLAYSQFEELEAFARFGTQLDEDTRQTLERGRRVREILKQKQYSPMPVAEQIAILVAVNEGVLDQLDSGDIRDAEANIRRAVTENLPELCEKIGQGEKISEDDIQRIQEQAQEAIKELLPDDDTSSKNGKNEIDGDR
ncbi:MAG: alternate F1F0 ATPase, F1 subunit alpha [Deltaproteobacteria bacterium]|nr:alternate F1F0 ATPase, F1 subunit alpha [Deltaproteobacteria bacterium]